LEGGSHILPLALCCANSSRLVQVNSNSTMLPTRYTDVLTSSVPCNKAVTAISFITTILALHVLKRVTEPHHFDTAPALTLFPMANIVQLFQHSVFNKENNAAC
jgi:hypothetical protein